jgi:hypothetical protein
MQKVEGSNPFSRFREGLRLQAFFVRAPRFAIASSADRIAVGSLRTYRQGPY